MEDIFESNGFLPLHYLIQSEEKTLNFDEKEEDASAKKPVEKIKLLSFNSRKYQTRHLVNIGIWKSVSNLHS